MVAKTRTAFHQEGLDLLKQDLLAPHRDRKAGLMGCVHSDILANGDTLRLYMEVMHVSLGLQIGKESPAASPTVMRTLAMFALYGLAEIVGEIPEMKEEAHDVPS